MKNLIKLGLIITLSLSSFASNISQSDFKAFQEEVNKRFKILEDENKKLKNELEDKALKEELEELQEVVDDVEVKAFSDRLNLGILNKNKYYYTTKKYTNGESISDSTITTKASIKMSANVSENLKFTGRASVFKMWSSGVEDDSAILSSQQKAGGYPANSAFYLERAYFDWKINPKSTIPLTLSLGRLPTSDGPSRHFSENIPRQANYPASTYDMTEDAGLISLDLSKITGLNGTKFRYMHTYYANRPKGTIGDFTDFLVHKDIKDFNVDAFFLESSIPTLDNSLIQLSFVDVGEPYIFLPNQQAMKMWSSKRIYSLMLETPNIFDTNLDLFIHYNHSKTTLSGQAMPVAFDENGVALAHIGIFTNQLNDTSTKDGDFIWLGARYELDFEYSPKIGFEYSKADKYYSVGILRSEDLTYKLGSVGDSYELYYIYPINDNFHLKVGSILINYDYTNDSMGEPISISEAKKSGLEGISEKLSTIYFEFNLNY